MGLLPFGTISNVSRYPCAKLPFTTGIKSKSRPLPFLWTRNVSSCIGPEAYSCFNRSSTARSVDIPCETSFRHCVEEIPQLDENNEYRLRTCEHSDSSRNSTAACCTHWERT